ncbi:MAG: Spy/CpxP family protein refolding chaperone [Candidatus Sericytochromatia bacterium]
MISKPFTHMALSALISVGVLSAPAMAQQTTPKPVAAAPGTINWALLRLTPAQTQKINVLRLEFEKKAIKIRADINLKQLEIQQQLMSPANNPSLVRKLLQEKLALENQLQTLTLDNFLAMKKVLTPQQVAMLGQAITIK